MNVSVVVPHLGLSQIGFYSVMALNKVIASKSVDDAVIFFEQITMPVLQPLCGTMCINELMSFKGTIITSTLSNTAMALARNSRSTNKVILYLWDLEWMRKQSVYNYTYNILNRVHKVYTRSLEHAKAVENYRGRPVDGVLEELNIIEIIK